MNLEISLIISQILAFILMLWILKRFAWKPLLKILDDRKDKIQAEFQAIEKGKGEIQEMKADYQAKLDEISAEAKIKIAEAVEMGRKNALQIQEDAQIQAKTILKKAQEDIENEIHKAQKRLKKNLVESVIATSEQLISVKLDSEQDRKIIGSLLEKIHDT